MSAVISLQERTPGEDSRTPELQKKTSGVHQTFGSAISSNKHSKEYLLPTSTSPLMT